MATAVGGVHPTGMHSCYDLFYKAQGEAWALEDLPWRRLKNLCSKLLDWLSYQVFLVNINSHQLEKEYKDTQNGIINGPKQWMKFEKTSLYTKREKPYCLFIEFNLIRAKCKVTSVHLGWKRICDFLLSLQLENFIEVLTCFSGDSEAIILGICHTQGQMPYG